MTVIREMKTYGILTDFYLFLNFLQSKDHKKIMVSFCYDCERCKYFEFCLKGQYRHDQQGMESEC